MKSINTNELRNLSYRDEQSQSLATDIEDEVRVQKLVSISIRLEDRYSVWSLTLGDRVGS